MVLNEKTGPCGPVALGRFLEFSLFHADAVEARGRERPVYYGPARYTYRGEPSVTFTFTLPLR